MVFFHGITTLPQFPRLVQDSSITFTPSSTASALEASANSFNKTDAGNGSNGICRGIDASRSPSPDPKRSAPR
ncbi:MAG: hypothetical protein ACKV19_29520, partial [Verrucomicrobiales bacterium]